MDILIYSIGSSSSTVSTIRSEISSVASSSTKSSRSTKSSSSSGVRRSAEFVPSRIQLRNEIGFLAQLAPAAESNPIHDDDNLDVELDYYQSLTFLNYRHANGF